MKFLNVLLAGFVLAGGSAFAADDKPDVLCPKSACVFTNSAGKTLNYRQYVPKDLKDGEKVPLVLFLHGAGERGDDNKGQLRHAVADLLAYGERSGKKFILIAPQCPQGKKWVDVSWAADAHTLPVLPSEQLGLVLEVLKGKLKELPIDAQRVYVTGLSMGGFGTWDIICREPELFAAAMPICGGGDVSCVEKIKNLPIRTFHGDMDTAVPVGRSQTMVEALKKAGGKCSYTEFPGAGHDVWTRVYKDDAVLNWLFDQHR